MYNIPIPIIMILSVLNSLSFSLLFVLFIALMLFVCGCKYTAFLALYKRFQSELIDYITFSQKCLKSNFRKKFQFP